MTNSRSVIVSQTSSQVNCILVHKELWELHVIKRYRFLFHSCFTWCSTWALLWFGYHVKDFVQLVLELLRLKDEDKKLKHCAHTLICLIWYELATYSVQKPKISASTITLASDRATMSSKGALRKLSNICRLLASCSSLALGFNSVKENTTLVKLQAITKLDSHRLWSLWWPFPFW